MSKDKGYRDPTADVAIGHVMREQRRKERMPKNRDGTDASWRRVAPSLDEELKKIDEKQKDY